MLPLDVRARLIGANARLLRQELDDGDLNDEIARRLRTLADQLCDHATALADELAPGSSKPAAHALGANVLLLRRRG